MTNSGRITNPAPIRRLGLKRSIEQIGRDGWVVIAHRRKREALTEARVQPVFLHHATDPFAAHLLVLLEKIFVDARAAIALCARLRTTPAPTRSAGDRRARASSPDDVARR